jgi:Domain of unknown function (DUF4440)
VIVFAIAIAKVRRDLRLRRLRGFPEPLPNDLAAYRSGMLKVKELRPSEQQIRFNVEVAIVSVRMLLAGTYDDSSANGDFRFTRVWALSPHKTWRVVAAHAGIVV